MSEIKRRRPGGGRPRQIMDGVDRTVRYPRSHLRALAHYEQHLGLSGLGATVRAVLDDPGAYSRWLELRTTR